MQQYIGFNIESNEYMIPILKVSEITIMPAITILPQLPAYVRGITNIRGTIMPIISLKTLLSSGNDEDLGTAIIVISNEKITFGIIVDAITGVVKVNKSDIAPPEKFADGNTDCIEGIAKLSNKLILLLNTDKLLPFNDVKLIEETVMNIESSDNGKDMEVKTESKTSGGKITDETLNNAKEFLDNKLDKNDPKHNIFEMMLNFMDVLSSGKYQQAENIAKELVDATDSDLFREVGKITRKLHDSLAAFKETIDTRLERLSNQDVPNVVDKLHFVISKTEDATNKTVEVIERYFEESNELLKNIESIKGHEENVNYLRSFRDSMDDGMTVILTSQQFQDITSQTIVKVIELVNNVETELLRLITQFGMPIKTGPGKFRDEFGPDQDITPKRVEKVTQSDVESLLNEFGF